jgi:hypothetical protein
MRRRFFLSTAAAVLVPLPGRTAQPALQASFATIIEKYERGDREGNAILQQSLLAERKVALRTLFKETRRFEGWELRLTSAIEKKEVGAIALFSARISPKSAAGYTLHNGRDDLGIARGTPAFDILAALPAERLARVSGEFMLDESGDLLATNPNGIDELFRLPAFTVRFTAIEPVAEPPRPEIRPRPPSK